MVLAKINITIPLLPINDHCSPLGHVHWLAPCRFEIAGRLLSKTRTGIILAIQTKPRPQLKAGTKELAIDQGQGPMVYSSLEPFGRHFIIQSRKNPISASAMLTGKFLQIRKVFATSSLLAEEFLDTLQYKISR